MEDSQIIKIENLIKRFPMGKGEFTALNGIGLTFIQGEFTGIVGPSGSGKTTLLNIIGSLDVPSSGSVTVLGRSVGDLGAKEAAKLRKENLGFIFQSYNLFAVHTVYENVEFPLLLLKYSSADRRRMVLDALEWVGLTDKIKSKPPQLSGGECQRVAIARAMVKKPSLVLADEPTANLDTIAAKEVMELFKRLNKDGHHTIVMITHEPEETAYANRLIKLADGRIV